MSSNVMEDDEGRDKSPGSMCVSVRSDQSIEIPLAFGNEPGPNITKGRKRPVGVKEEERFPGSNTCGHRVWGQNEQTGDESCCGKRKINSEWPDESSTDIKPKTDTLQEVLHNHKIHLGKRCEFAIEGTSDVGSRTHLKKIYTELYITEGQCEGVNVQHEVWKLETLSKMETLQETPIKCHDIFKMLPHQKKTIRVVLTNGIAGIGKTFLVQKFTLDWAECLENQDISLVVLFSFRELNLIRDKSYSLLRLLCDFHPTLHTVSADGLDLCKVLFIFDGLDENRLSLDFQNDEEIVSDVTQTSSVNVLFMNLIKGNLLPSALLWITSRPAAANLIPSAYVDRITEVRGFTDSQKEEYFRRRLGYESTSDQIISHIKTSRSLYIMCHIPVFCWVTATVLEQMLDRKDLPKTLTEMYSHFLLVQAKRKRQKYDKETDKDILLKLGRLAFEHLEQGNIMFYHEDLDRCGLDVKDASVFSGLCTEIFKREHVLFKKIIYCFVHLSIQEFLAAVYMIHCYLNNNKTVLVGFLGEEWDANSNLESFLSKVLDKSLNSPSGHLDLFVRFLHGLLLESNHHLLGGLLGWIACSPESIQMAKNNLKKMNAYDISPDRSINIFHCLMEMNDHSVHQEIQEFLQSEDRSEKKLTKTHCSALAYMLQMSEEVLDMLDLKRYNASGDGRRRLLPAVRNCKAARLSCCGLSELHCEVLSSALTSSPSHLRELDLSENDYLLDTGVKLLSVGLKSANCKLEILRLKNCSLSESCCEFLASALRSPSTRLKELDLSNNNYIQDSGVKMLSKGLESPHCRLETLRLSCCRLSEICSAHLVSALKSNPEYMKMLDLSKNKLKDSGVRFLSAAIGKQECKLETLKLDRCGLTETCCSYLASALKSDPSSLRELELSYNDLQDPGVTLLCVGLESPHCRLEALRLRGCWLSESSCGLLAAALMSKTCTMKELDLSENDLLDAGVKMLCTGLESQHCRLEILRLMSCCVTGESCVFLASALKSNPFCLKDLDLRKNNLQESAVKPLSDLRESPDCRLDIVRTE